MFGRVSKGNYGGRSYSYYTPGVFHHTPYKRISKGNLFVGTRDFIDYSPVLGFCHSFITASVSRDEQGLETGEEKWKKVMVDTER